MNTGELLECCLDEIALDGLEGINIAGLWTRLEQRLSEDSVKLDEYLKQFLWQCIAAHEDIEFFEVSTPPEPIGLSRFRLRDPELGFEICPSKQNRKNELDTIINDKTNNVRGLCANFHSRTNVTSVIRGEDRTVYLKLPSVLEKWGDRLILVASQDLRNLAIFGKEADPEVELSDMHHAILEKLAKSRHLGQLQPEICSSFNIDAKNMFYQRKKLFAKGYITVQNFAVRLASGRLQNSVLLLLKRFHVDYRSKYDTLAEKLSDILNTKPEKTESFTNVKKDMGLVEDHQTFKKLLKYVLGLNLVKAFPVKKEIDKGKRGKRTETTWCIRLLKSYSAMKAEAGGDEDEEDDSDSDLQANKVAKVRELPLLNQVYNLVEQYGSNGVSLTTLRRLLDLGRLETRQIGKNLLRSGTVQCIPHDEGRQRTYRYVTINNLADSKLRKDLEKEKRRSRLLEKKTEKVPTGISPKQEIHLGESELGTGSMNSTPCMTPAGSPLPASELSSPNSPADYVAAKMESVKDKEIEGIIPGKSTKMMTARVLKRRNIIIETVRTCRVVHGVITLLKAVLNAEREEGINYRCDKKSIIRLVKTLVQEGLIRQFTTIVATDDGSARTKVDFITDVNIKCDDELVKSAVMQIKFRMENVLKQKQEKLEKLEKAEIKHKHEPRLRRTSSSKSKKCGKHKTEDVKLERIKLTSGIIGSDVRKYGYLPKMPRLKLIHEYIWYLVYGYKGKLPRKVNDEEVVLVTNEGKDKEEITGDMSKVSDESLELGTTSKHADISQTSLDGKSQKQQEEETVHGSEVQYSEEDGQNKSETDNQGDTHSECVILDPTPGTPHVTVGETHTLTDTAKEPMLHSGKESNPESTSKALATVYVDEMNWRRFLPPLPRYNDCGQGWCLVSDLLLWMPLSIFCSIVQLSYKVDNLEEYLSHPLKRNILLGHLPRRMRIQLLQRRKYVFTFDENIKRLSAMGLVIYGPQKSEMKDQVFIYVCKNASLKDTSPCLPHYNRAMGGPFKKKQYCLTSERELEQYWFALQCICLSTPLGVVRAERKKGNHKTRKDENGVATNAGTKKDENALSNTIKSLFMTVDDISKPPREDNGTIPGDSQGAGGMDSSFYAHLKRNWQWVVPHKGRHGQSSKMVMTSPSCKPMADILEEGVASTSGELTPDALIQLVSEPSRVLRRTVGETVKKKKKPTSAKISAKKKQKATKATKKPKSGPRDATDARALQKMTKQRVGWTAQEDSLLLLCRVASTLLNKKKKDFVAWSVVRDLLHQSYECSTDKTSAAVNRRSKYILNNPQTGLNLKICLAEVYQDKELLQSIMAEKGDYDNPEVCTAEYNDLVSKLRDKFSSLPGDSEFDLPDTLEELHNKYKLVPIGHKTSVDNSVVLRTKEDIIKAQLMNLIQISLSMDPSEYNSHQVFKVYENYPTELLEAAFLALRNKGLVNRKRGSEGYKTTRNVPFAAMSYQLSMKYHRYFLGLIPVSVFQESKQFFQKLKSKSSEDDFWLNFPTDSTGGPLCCIATLMTMKKLVFNVVIPEQVVLVDSELLENQVMNAGKLSVNSSTINSDDSDDEEPTESDLSRLTLLAQATLQASASTKKATGSQIQSKTSTPAVDVQVDSEKTEPMASTSRGDEPMPGPSQEIEPMLSTSQESGPMPASSRDDEPVTNTSGVATPTSTSSAQNITYDVTPRQASRSNLLLFRGQYSPGIVNKRNLNPQDNIVVNPCTLSMALAPEDDSERAMVKFESDSNDFKSVPRTICAMEDTESVNLADLCKSTIVPRNNVSLDDVIAKCKGQGYEESFTNVLKDVYDMIDIKKLFGVPKSAVGMMLDVADKHAVEKAVDVLLADYLVIEVGVSEPVLVSRQYASPWLIHSFKVPRSSKLIGSDSSSQAGDAGTRTLCGSSEKGGGGTSKTTSSNRQGSDVDTSNTQHVRSQDTSTTQCASSLDGNGDTTTQRGSSKDRDVVGSTTHQRKKLRTSEKSQTANIETENLQHEDPYEPVEFLSHPWLTVEGKPNIATLRTMLQGVLLLIMNSPGITHAATVRKYQGVLHPVAVELVLQMLLDLGCVTKTTRQQKKCSLFSDSWDTTKAPTVGEHVYYEPTVDCVLKLAASQ
ncbi:general transcription factor 3C polypeptide 1-like [Glandiceps talaboti]